MAKPKKTAAVTPKPPPEKDPETGRFVTGNIGGGRKPGSRAKLGETFLADLQADWEKNGADVIEAVRKDRPQDYLKVVASILPKELNVRVSEFEEMTDEQLDQRIRQLAAFLEIGIGKADERAETAH